MEVTFAVLADCANITADNKVNIMGVFGEINPASLPFSLPTLFLVMQFSASPIEIGTKKHIKVALLDSDGKRILELDADTEVPQPTRPGSKSNVVSIVGLNGIPFSKADHYQFAILVNGDEIATILG